MRNFDFSKLIDSPEDLLKAAVSTEPFITYKEAFRILDDEVCRQAQEFLDHASKTKHIYYQNVNSRSKSKKYFKIYTVTEDYVIKQFRTSIYRFLDKSKHAYDVMCKMSFDNTGINQAAELYLCYKLHFDLVKDCIVVDTRSETKYNMDFLLLLNRVNNHIEYLASLAKYEDFSIKKLGIKIYQL